MDGLFRFVYFAGRGQSANIFPFNSAHLRTKGLLMKPNLSVRYCRPLILFLPEMFSWFPDYRGNFRDIYEKGEIVGEIWGEKAGGVFENRGKQENASEPARKIESGFDRKGNNHGASNS
ncbi:hypothetical protein QE152_g10775 [Popillia japonica]|uniref:Uncharacterized protein n=1 Tax=Popillia japonica TaxID=7064 RepID=A0AAW1LU47_POPJA